MKIIKYLYCLIYIYNIIYYKHVLSNPTDTLNIIKYNQKLAYTEHFEKPNHSYTLYYLKDSANVKKIIDGFSTIWSSRNGETLLFLVVYKWYGMPRLTRIVFKSIISDDKYYERLEYDWFPISREVFNAKVNMIEKSYRFNLNERPDESKFLVDNHNIGGLPAKVIIPLNEITISQILDGHDFVWKQKDEKEKCSCMIIHGHLNDIQMMHLHIVSKESHEEKFMRKYLGEWREVKKVIFYRILSHLDKLEEMKTTNIKRK